MNAPSKQRGFTLIEVIVAFAIGVVAVFLSYQTLTAAITSSERTTAVATEIDDISRAMYLLETDFRHIIARDTSLFNVNIPTGFSTESDREYVLKFIRAGRPNPLALQRSALLQVGYRLEDKVLYRDTWPETIDPDREEAMPLELVFGVTDLVFHFLPANADNREGPWQDVWPGPSGSGLPIAVEIELETEAFGRIKRLFLLEAES